jgi:hypothetical protein
VTTSSVVEIVGKGCNYQDSRCQQVVLAYAALGGPQVDGSRVDVEDVADRISAGTLDRYQNTTDTREINLSIRNTPSMRDRDSRSKLKLRAEANLGGRRVDLSSARWQKIIEPCEERARGKHRCGEVGPLTPDGE